MRFAAKWKSNLRPCRSRSSAQLHVVRHSSSTYRPGGVPFLRRFGNRRQARLALLDADHGHPGLGHHSCSDTIGRRVADRRYPRGIVVGVVPVCSYRDASADHSAVHLRRYPLHRRLARHDFARRASTVQHIVGDHFSRRTGDCASDRRHGPDRWRDYIDLMANRSATRNLSLVAYRLSTRRCFSGRDQPSAASLFTGFGQRTPVSRRGNRCRRAPVAR